MKEFFHFLFCNIKIINYEMFDGKTVLSSMVVFERR